MSNRNEIVYRNFLILSAGALVMTGHGQLKMKHDTEIFQKRPNIRPLCVKSDLSILISESILNANCMSWHVHP